MTKREELDEQILWFEALQDSIEDGDIESALKAIEAALALLRRQRRNLKG